METSSNKLKNTECFKGYFEGREVSGRGIGVKKAHPIHTFLKMLLACAAALFTLSAATIHEDRGAVFRSVAQAQALPEEVEDMIWEYYVDLVNRDKPQSPILSLEDTQSLFPLLHLDWTYYWWSVEYISKTEVVLPEDRYLTLHVTDSSQDQDHLSFRFNATGESCRSVNRYILSKDKTIQEWTGVGYKKEGYWKTPRYIIEKDELNSDLEPGTALLLYIPQGCSIMLKLLERIFRIPVHNKHRLPTQHSETILLSDEMPPECRQLSWFSRLLQWLEKIFDIIKAFQKL